MRALARHNDFRDERGLREECEHGRTLGMDGKTLIHPSQIAPCNEVFSASIALEALYRCKPETVRSLPAPHLVPELRRSENCHLQVEIGGFGGFIVSGSYPFSPPRDWPKNVPARVPAPLIPDSSRGEKLRQPTVGRI
jgi:hypothetical protein